MAGFPNYTYPAYGGYNPVTPFAPAPQIYQPMQQPAPAARTGAQTVESTNTQPNFSEVLWPPERRRLGVPVDFMGAPMFFPDLAHNVVYMKRFNTTAVQLMCSSLSSMYPEKTATKPLRRWRPLLHWTSL